ncbi:hypothetical protein [Flavivirga jejuensis]|uniref:Uncharacterized protein n=1 Tax=Flavivirga jejuensis TaxID=870487 RepID=A0ABT8WTM9_9FLAO|nr:hypothetical protein [Flavivirga jejuensis]MDO5976344.1 hypothetical protein [Flavivirga jejuensis]
MKLSHILYKVDNLHAAVKKFKEEGFVIEYDTQNRLLKHKVLFPNEQHIPFLMTFFNKNPKPSKGFAYPNGIKGIKSISFGTQEKFIPLIKELCNDPALKLYLGNDVKDLEYETK